MLAPEPATTLASSAHTLPQGLQHHLLAVLVPTMGWKVPAPQESAGRAGKEERLEAYFCLGVGTGSLANKCEMAGGEAGREDLICSV